MVIPLLLYDILDLDNLIIKGTKGISAAQATTF